MQCRSSVYAVLYAKRVDPYAISAFTEKKLKIILKQIANNTRRPHRQDPLNYLSLGIIRLSLPLNHISSILLSLKECIKVHKQG